jgi:Uma2 family endonuclease
MLAVEKKKKYTVDDYMMLEEGAPFQLINYDLIMSPSPIPLHQVISHRIELAIGIFLMNEKNKGFFVSAPMDVRFDNGNIFQPDILYINKERVSEIVTDTRIEGAPDIIIEILSSSTAIYDLRQKKDTYEKYGVKEYIVIDPVSRNADLYALKHGVYYLDQKANETEELASLILPGCTLDLNKIFNF